MNIMEQKQQIDHYRNSIQQMLRRVPDSVNGGTYDRASAFKKVAAKACKVANQGNPKLAALIEAHNQLASYY